MSQTENNTLTFRGKPLMRKGNIIYYGSMSDKYIVMLEIHETKKVRDLEVASRVSVQLQLTSPGLRAKDRIVKKSEKEGLFAAIDVGSIWLDRAMSQK